MNGLRGEHRHRHHHESYQYGTDQRSTDRRLPATRLCESNSHEPVWLLQLDSLQMRSCSITDPLPCLVSARSLAPASRHPPSLYLIPSARLCSSMTSPYSPSRQTQTSSLLRSILSRLSSKPTMSINFPPRFVHPCIARF